MRHLILYCVLVCAGFNNSTAQNFSQKDFKRLDWITGSWKMNVKNGVLHEQWHKLNDSTLQSKGFIIKSAGDTLLLEAVQIKFRGKHLYYVPTINGQNNNAPVTFVFTGNAGQSFTAENPGHDFPQKIYYARKTDRNMYAAVSGDQKGKTRKEEFNFTKE